MAEEMDQQNQTFLISIFEQLFQNIVYSQGLWSGHKTRQTIIVVIFKITSY
jgi:hypothetical protein